MYYPDFVNILRTATDNRNKIEKNEKEGWAGFVRKHDVPEAAMEVKGKGGTLSGKINVVIIEGAGEVDGYYAYSADDQFSLNFESGLE